MVLVDEVAFLTAYQPDRKLKDRIMAALATLTTQGRAVGYAEAYAAGSKIPFVDDQSSGSG